MRWFSVWSIGYVCIGHGWFWLCVRLVVLVRVPCFEVFSANYGYMYILTDLGWLWIYGCCGWASKPLIFSRMLAVWCSNRLGSAGRVVLKLEFIFLILVITQLPCDVLILWYAKVGLHVGFCKFSRWVCVGCEWLNMYVCMYAIRVWVLVQLCGGLSK